MPIVRALLLVCFGLAGASGSPSSAPPTGSAAPAPRCATRRERFDLQLGQSARAVDGARVTYGARHVDDYDDGFEILATLTLEVGARRQTFMASMLAPNPVEVLGHCVWVGSAGNAARVTIGPVVP